MKEDEEESVYIDILLLTIKFWGFPTWFAGFSILVLSINQSINQIKALHLHATERRHNGKWRSSYDSLICLWVSVSN